MSFADSQSAIVMMNSKLGMERAEDDGTESTSTGGGSEIASLPVSPATVSGFVKDMVSLPTNLADLPSIGSLGHFLGQCSRCCFFPKGRCLNGYDCRFCHFDHEKRHRKKTVLAGRLGSSTSEVVAPASMPLRREAAVVSTPPGLERVVAQSSFLFETPPFGDGLRTQAPIASMQEVADKGVVGPNGAPEMLVQLDAAPKNTGNPCLPPCTLADLPSIGSLGHFAGQCSRCCFFSKGRCLNGYDCRFCHFEHEKRPRKKKTLTTRCPEKGARFVPLSMASGAADVAFGSDAMTVNVTAGFDSWSVDEVVTWLGAVGLGHCVDAFQQHRISGDVLSDLSSDDLAQMGFTAVGDKKRILSAVASLCTSRLEAYPGNLIGPHPVSTFRTDVCSPQVSEMMTPSSVGFPFVQEMCPPPSWDASCDQLAPVAPPVVGGLVAQELCPPPCWDASM